MTEYRAGASAPADERPCFFDFDPDRPDPSRNGTGEHPLTIEGSEITTVRTAKDPAEVRTEVELSVLHRSTHTLIRVRGEIDFAAAPGLRERLLGLLQPGMGLVILDLSGVSFCDASGLGVLVGSHRRATMLGVTLRLTGLRPRVARLLYISGVNRILVYPALPDALTWRGARGRRRQP